MTDIEKGKTQLNESEIAECGDMGMSVPAPVEQGNPVTASITLNASGMNHVADLMRLLQQAGIDKAGPPATQPMPIRMDMERLRDKMAGLEKPGMESSLADDVQNSEIAEWDNEPEEEYQDHNYMLDDLAGGINKPKRMYKPAAKGDNPMAVESIKDRLYRKLSEKKAKPDYLDIDGDGDKKEPMKKAAKDKKKKGPVKEAFGDKNTIKSQKGKSGSLITIDEHETAIGKKSYVVTAIINTRPMYRTFNNLSQAEEWFDIATNLDDTKGVFIFFKYGQYGTKEKNEDNIEEAEFRAPSSEIDDTARKAMAVVRKIRRKINSGDTMDDRDYNQMAELGNVLSRLGTSFGPRTMKDVMNHMVQYTDDRNEEGHNYPKFDFNRFKELVSMANSTSESTVSEDYHSDNRQKSTLNEDIIFVLHNLRWLTESSRKAEMSRRLNEGFARLAKDILAENAKIFDFMKSRPTSELTTVLSKASLSAPLSRALSGIRKQSPRIFKAVLPLVVAGMMAGGSDSAKANDMSAIRELPSITQNVLDIAKRLDAIERRSATPANKPDQASGSGSAASASKPAQDSGRGRYDLGSPLGLKGALDQAGDAARRAAAGLTDIPADIEKDLDSAKARISGASARVDDIKDRYQNLLRQYNR